MEAVRGEIAPLGELVDLVSRLRLSSLVTPASLVKSRRGSSLWGWVLCGKIRIKPAQMVRLCVWRDANVQDLLSKPPPLGCRFSFCRKELGGHQERPSMFVCPKVESKTRSPSSALSPFFGEGSPTRIDYRKKVGALILTSLLEDLEKGVVSWFNLSRPL